MPKIICETTGDFQLVDYGNQGRVIPAFRPSVAELSHFVSARAAAGQIRVITNVSEDATDEEFEAYLKDTEDNELAIAAFVDAYSDKPVEKKSAKKAKPAKADEPEVAAEPEPEATGAAE